MGVIRSCGKAIFYPDELIKFSMKGEVPLVEQEMFIYL